MSNDTYLPPCKFAHEGKVRILKVVDADGKSHGGFQWPKSGEVKPETWSDKPDCESGGLFGWAWGLAFGDGKDPVFANCAWIVFECDTEDTVHLSGKCKAKQGTVIHFGDYSQALHLIIQGQIAYIQAQASGAASATGDRGAASATGARGAASATGWSGAASATGASGAASATGESGAASATGESGAASATGWRGAASATGARGAASATGESGAASATGWSGAASATGWSGAASATGWRGAASATGWRGAASATGARGAASATGESGAASATGARGAASATGESGAASATGWSGAASATGWSGAASATGERGIACSTGEQSTVQCGKDGLAVTTATQAYWQVTEGSVFVQRVGKDVWMHKARVKDVGKTLVVINGEIQESN